jgi:cellulose synthase/poly-beta-1,6-N-acetylglucosamine synthase-like glycosyltransferase
LSLALVVIFNLKVPISPYALETQEYQNAELSDELRNIYYMMLATHVFCTFASFFAKIENDGSSELVMWKSLFIIVAMCLQVLNITTICGFIFSESSITEGVVMSSEFTSFNIWLQIEVAIFASILLSNIMFLFIRSFVTAKVSFSKLSNFGIRTDYLEAQQDLGNYFVDFFVPAGVLCFVFYLKPNSDALQDDGGF